MAQDEKVIQADGEVCIVADGEPVRGIVPGFTHYRSGARVVDLLPAEPSGEVTFGLVVREGEK